ncbi:MAG TPA: FlgD immunoglobulin-like domain containing protein [Geobacteraceae bacterium]|nr:FlgD immunoglobulin-like domain containing protein [Geobacteraceae bacterium]
MINAVSTNSSNTTTAATNMKQDVGFNQNDFLQMLVAELQNQDPMNPQDSSQFVTQLAQISQVEQTYNINSNLQTLLNSMNNSTALSTVSFIGKDITAQGSQVALTSGGTAALGFTLPSAATQVTVQIQDANGNTVRTLTQGATAAGASSITWDGLSDSGQTLPSGTYSFAVSGTSASGQAIQGSTVLQGLVTGVDMSGTTPALIVNGTSVPLTSVVSVQGGSM